MMETQDKLQFDNSIVMDDLNAVDNIVVSDCSKSILKAITAISTSVCQIDEMLDTDGVPQAVKEQMKEVVKFSNEAQNRLLGIFHDCSTDAFYKSNFSQI